MAEKECGRVGGMDNDGYKKFVKNKEGLENFQDQSSDFIDEDDEK